jgi:hypothetical protein
MSRVNVWTMCTAAIGEGGLVTAIEVRPLPPAPLAPRTGLRRLATTARTTPGRLSITTLLLVVLSVSVGASSYLALQERTTAVHNLTVAGGPFDASALEIYRSLSDADATAASEFLAARGNPSALRARYLKDIASATDALTIASSRGAGDPQSADELLVLISELPVYTGLVETARANNRLGFPLGSAYLREASGLMRHKLLPAARRLYEAEKQRLAVAQTDATATPWAALSLIGATLLALLAVQVMLTRRTKRIFNVWLVVGTLATIAVGAWIVLATSAMAEHLEVARSRGAAQAQILAEARIATLQIRADEALTLVARGSGQEIEVDYDATMHRLQRLLNAAESAAPDAASKSTIISAREDLLSWAAAHEMIRQLDEQGRYPEAVELATDPGKSGPALFASLDQRLGDGIEERREIFNAAAVEADRDLAGSRAGVLSLTLLMLLATTIGLQARIAEYR